MFTLQFNFWKSEMYFNSILLLILFLSGSVFPPCLQYAHTFNSFIGFILISHSCFYTLVVSLNFSLRGYVMCSKISGYWAEECAWVWKSGSCFPASHSVERKSFLFGFNSFHVKIRLGIVVFVILICLLTHQRPCTLQYLSLCSLFLQTLPNFKI